MSDDFYCEEVFSGHTPVNTVMDTEDVLAFEHTRPSYPVHIVVVPKKHVPSLIDLGDDGEQLLGKLLLIVRQVAKQITVEHGACRVVTNLGQYQDSRHLHFHVVFGKPLTTHK